MKFPSLPTNKAKGKPKMVSLLSHATTLIILFFFLLSSFFTVNNGKFSEQFPETKADNHLEKMIYHLHFYFHDIISGKHPTAINIAGQKNAFGSTVIIDDPLTEGTKHGSKVVGRAQGMYAMSSQDNASLLMVMNFSFIEGKYNGSSISILGTNRFLESVREMPIIGGSGLFRLARGYVLAKTHRFNLKTGDAVVEYNVFVTNH